jgi:dephospho-CoA kinase
MIVAGLTGSIATGKSTVGAIFAALGAPVFDADAAVRDFYARAGAGAVEAMFPGVLVDGQIDRESLGRRVLGDKAALRRLENLVHPEVVNSRARFLECAAADGRRLSVVDVPLLLETDSQAGVDFVVVVSATEALQRNRALGRPGMSGEKFDAVLSHQMPDPEKRRRAHFVIDATGSLQQTRAQVGQLVRAIAGLERHRSHRA